MQQVLRSVQLSREKLEDYINQLGVEWQTINQNLQALSEEQLTLQNSLVGTLAQFEEKAGQGQGLQGIFNGNPILKNDIMQKRVNMENVLIRLRSQTKNISQKVETTSKMLQEVFQKVPSQLKQEESNILQLEQNFQVSFSQSQQESQQTNLPQQEDKRH